MQTTEITTGITIAQGQTSTIVITCVQDDMMYQSYSIEEAATLHLELREHVVGNQLSLAIYCYKDAMFMLTFYIKKTFNLTVNIHLLESGAQAHVKGAYVLGEHDAVTVTTKQLHMAPHTQSDLIIKGVLDDNARAHYHGTIFVTQQAYATKANQQNKHMLLSPHAQAVSIPSLEVLTDDVQCAHGSAAGYVDRDHLFYLASRGLPFDDARALLIRAFLHEVK